MATDLGKVGIVTKGAWSSSATYEVLDAVTYYSGLYIAKQAVPAGTLPTNTTYWQAAAVPTPTVDKYTTADCTSLGIISTTFTLLKASLVIVRYSANYGIVSGTVTVSNGDSGIPLSRQTLFTINPNKITSDASADALQNPILETSGNTDTTGSGYRVAAVAPSFLLRSSGDVTCDVNRGLYSPDGLVNSKPKCITTSFIFPAEINI